LVGRAALQCCQIVYFHTKNPNSEYIFKGLGMEIIGVFYEHMEYCTAIL
jgi:hypothetical protein